MQHCRILSVSAVFFFLAFIAQATIPHACAQVCGDLVWDDCEYCGQDAYYVSGVPDLEHDGDVDVVDFILFALDWGGIGPGHTGDLDRNNQVGLTDWTMFVFHWHDTAMGFTPCIPYPDSCAGRIRISFTGFDPAIDDDLAVGSPYEAWIVVEDCPGLMAAEWNCKSSPNVEITSLTYSGSLTPEWVSGFSEPLDENPAYAGRIEFTVLDSEPGWLKICGSPEGDETLCWAQIPPPRKMFFETVCHAGINGTPPADSAGCLPSSRVAAEETGPALPTVRCEPNPVVHGIRVLADLPTSQEIAISVCDPEGREVRRLFVGRSGPGPLRLDWNGHTNDGVLLPGGVYFVRVAGSGFKLSKRIILLR